MVRVFFGFSVRFRIRVAIAMGYQGDVLWLVARVRFVLGLALGVRLGYHCGSSYFLMLVVWLGLCLVLWLSVGEGEGLGLGLGLAFAFTVW